MIAFIQPESVSAPDKAAPDWHAQFLDMLPTIRRYARCSFRNLPPQARYDAVGARIDRGVAKAQLARALGELRR